MNKLKKTKEKGIDWDDTIIPEDEEFYKDDWWYEDWGSWREVEEE